MTQIIHLVTRGYVFQVSDRLLSRPTISGYAEFDRNSNKSIIFTLADAHGIAAYTGRAYLEAMPSDTFITKNLIGVDQLNDVAFVSLGNEVSLIDIGRSVERVRQALSDAFDKLPLHEKKLGFEVCFAGWRVKRKRYVPFIWTIKKVNTGQNFEFIIDRVKPSWHWFRQYTVECTPDLSYSPVYQWLRSELKSRAIKGPEEVEKVLIEALCKCSDERPDTVGRSCLQITVNRFDGAPHDRIRFIRDMHKPNELSQAGVGYTPWIIHYPMTWGPSVIGGGGGWTNGQSGYSWALVGIEKSENRRHFSQSTQKRPPDPQSK